MNSLLSSPSIISNQELLSALAFTSSSDPWTDGANIQLSDQFLSNNDRQAKDPGFIVNYLLQTTLRPLFSKSRPDTITESGRKAMPSSAPARRYDFVQEKSQKPWKYEAPYSIAVLEWVVKVASVRLGSLLNIQRQLFYHSPVHSNQFRVKSLKRPGISLPLPF